MKKPILIVGAVAVVIALAAFHAPTPRVALQSTPHARARRSPHPHATVRETMLVYVAGEVRHPGLYRIVPGERAADAVGKAGGFTSGADRAGVNLAAPLQDGDEVRVPSTSHARRRSSGITHARKSKRKRGSRRAATAPIDLNTVDAESLQGIPGIGPTLAQRIIAYRRLNGPFASVDGLLDVAGFSPARLDRIAPFVRV